MCAVSSAKLKQFAGRFSGQPTTCQRRMPLATGAVHLRQGPKPYGGDALRLRSREPAVEGRPLLCDCVFDGLHRPSPDNLPGRLGFEYCWFLCERIDAITLLCCGFLDDNKF